MFFSKLYKSNALRIGVAFSLILIFTSAILIEGENDFFIFLRGKKQHVLLEGKGEPTIVFITAKGCLYTDYKKVYSKVKNFTQIFAYDRAGLGLSESLKNQRSVDTMAFELNELLVKENIKPPYILVGHSLGSYIMRCFVNRYPQKAAGMIFIEPAHEQEYIYGLSIRNDSDKVVFKNQYKSFLNLKGATKGQRAESKYCFDFDSNGYSTNQRIVKDLMFPSQLPITIILSTVADVENDYIEKETKYKIDFFEKWKTYNPQLKIITTDKSSYFIQKEQPHLVINEIEEMISKLK